VLLSMTGFSRESESFKWGTLSVEISSINHRYLDVSIRLPRELSFCEPSINDQVRSSLRRGKVRLSVDVTWPSDLLAVTVNSDILKNYYYQIQKIQEDLHISDPINIVSLLHLPGVTDSPSNRQDMEKEVEQALEDIVRKAVSSLQVMREKEGAHLEEDINTHLSSFHGFLNNIQNRWINARDEAMVETRERIKKILEENGPDLDEGRIAQEIALMADKWDISEELTRAESHIKKFQSILKSSESEGRKMDFLIQEMNREINTIGSKVTDSDIRWLVVEAKTALERIREQVQNVE
jgi:uncharacterized protein (TIGR00255 family)